ncbi:Probable sugar phosphate/phosphate translocator At1g53660 [Durusdinium trenchii]|uniref:Probable sugar phosphate/phosphate translocator At1g53660 n=1 Tax=Durusdinium trenchii TaxID=1381693 RepID=A0ABP0QLK6_9DINO
MEALCVCSVYMVVGPTLMLVNKDIMSRDGDIVFPYPFLLSSLGLVFTSALTHGLHAWGKLRLPHAEVVTRRFWVRNLLPVGACHAATLAFGNAQYLYMGVALIQFLKAFTPVVVTCFVWLLLGKKASGQVWLALALTCLGTSMTAAGALNLNLFGLLLAAGSSSTEAVRLVLTQFALQDCNFGLLEGQYFLAPAGALCLLLLSGLFEFGTIYANGDFYKFHLFPMQFCLAGSLGFGVQMLTAGVIKLTSSITLKVLSQLRNALVVLSGVLLYGEVVTTLQLVGYLLAVTGILRYSLVVAAEKKKSGGG